MPSGSDFRPTEPTALGSRGAAGRARRGRGGGNERAEMHRAFGGHCRSVTVTLSGTRNCGE